MTKIMTKPGDKFGLGGKEFVVSASRGEHCLAYPAGRPELTQQFSRVELAALLGRNDFSFTPGSGMPLTSVARPSINALSEPLRGTILRRLAYVEGYIQLLGASKFLNSKSAKKDMARWKDAMHLTGGQKFYRTRKGADAAARFLQPKIDRIGAFVATDAHQIKLGSEDAPHKPRKQRQGSPKLIVNEQAQVEELEEPSGSILLEWLKRYEAGEGHWESLKPRYALCGNHTPKLEDDVQAIITEQLPTYLTKEAISAERYRENVNTAITAENGRRNSAGEPRLEHVGIGAIRKVIDQIDPYFADLCREDEAIVKARWRWVQDAIEYQVAGQRIEIDAYQTDLMTLMIMSGAWAGLNREQRRKLKRERLWLTIAIDGATRVILGMRLSATPTVPNGIAVLDMIESDKTDYSEAAGCETPWTQRTGLCTVVADGGYITHEMRTAVTEARATFENPIAGAAHLRAIVERIFRTVATRLMARLKGKTFSDIFKRGEYDSEGNASLTVDELAWILVTWVVDIYHQTEHEGLCGLTPAQAWDMSEDKYGIRPWRDSHGRRTAFGVRLERAVTEQGVEVLGNFYRDDSAEGLRRLQKMRHAGKAIVMVDIANLGAISIVIDEVAYTLPARDRRMEGMRAVDWIEATKSLRRQYAGSAVVSRDIAYRALARIIDKNNAAAERSTIVSTVYSVEDLDWYEDGLFKRIRYAEPAPNEASLPIGEAIQAIEHAPVSLANPDASHDGGDTSDAKHPAIKPPAKRKSKWSTSK